MKTNEKLIKIVTAMGGHEFTKGDWYAFAGCESENPWIAEIAPKGSEPGYTIIADGECLDFYPCSENLSETMEEGWTHLKVEV